MAKLSAHGPCVLRIEKKKQETDDREWTRRTYSFHRDRTRIVALAKFDTKYRVPGHKCGGGILSSGWKLAPTENCKLDTDLNEVADLYEDFGWRITRLPD